MAATSVEVTADGDGLVSHAACPVSHAREPRRDSIWTCSYSAAKGELCERRRASAPR